MKRAKGGKFGVQKIKRHNSGQFGASPSSSQSPGADTILKEKNDALSRYADKLAAELPRPVAERLRSRRRYEEEEDAEEEQRQYELRTRGKASYAEWPRGHRPYSEMAGTTSHQLRDDIHTVKVAALSTTAVLISPPACAGCN